MASTTCPRCGAPLEEQDRSATACRYCRASFQRPEEELPLSDVVQLIATSRREQGMIITLRDGGKQRVQWVKANNTIKITELTPSGEWRLVAEGAAQDIAKSVEGVLVVEATTS